MASILPAITIQCDWNDVLRLPKGEAWLSAKYLNANSVHDKITATHTDGKIKLTFSDNYNLVSLSSLCIVLKHIESDAKFAFVAPTKVHNIHRRAILSVSTAENALVISSCEGDKLLVWDSRTNEILLDLRGHGGPVYKCRFFPSGIVVISAGADGSCRIWSAESGINPVTLKGHTMSVADVCIVEKGRNVISVSKDGLAKLWDVGESRCIDNIIQAPGPINCCAIGTTTDYAEVESPREIGTNNKVLVVGCESGLVIAAHIAKREELFHTQLESACNACIVMEDTVILGCDSGKIVFLNIKDGTVTKELHESASPVFSLAALPNHMFAAGRQDGHCTVISLLEIHNKLRVQLTGSDCDGIRDIAFNGKWILAASRDSSIRKYDFNQVNVHFK